MEVPHLIQHINFNSTFMVFDLIAVFLFAVSGALTAIRKKYDFIGVLVLAFFSGIGGGLIRDAVFIQSGPPLAVTDNKYPLVIFIAFILSMILHKPLSKMWRTMLLVDALGLGIYGVVGAHAALQGGLVPLAAILVGVFNAVGAGLIRDVLIREEPYIFKPGQFYAGAAILGCCIFVLMVVAIEADDILAALLSISVTFVVRLLSVRYDWQTKPILK
ncbi:MAG TPA: trimeric intracellular cation channel family protein [Cyclobacteriaceae bacterium]|jgi:uncharacterized membrane protein YeiH|nr:trimeric intracellular cation channel family protein [Cyclobacteriaceae bacterium]